MKAFQMISNVKCEMWYQKWKIKPKVVYQCNVKYLYKLCSKKSVENSPKVGIPNEHQMQDSSAYPVFVL